MWDGRETLHGETLDAALHAQAIDATLGHAQAANAPAAAAVDQIVREELGAYFAQRHDNAAGDLMSDGATGGPQPLAALNPRAPGPFTLFDAWKNSSSAPRASIARGQQVFNTRGCTTCHDVPEVGTNSQGLLFDIGTSEAARRPASVPLYTFENASTHEQRSLTDPGQGLVTGKWSDLGKFKVPSLRGLASRAPYFHDGSAPDIASAVDDLGQRFQLGLTDAERQDLIAFLGAL
jgi:hypothetical protein